MKEGEERDESIGGKGKGAGERGKEKGREGGRRVRRERGVEGGWRMLEYGRGPADAPDKNSTQQLQANGLWHSWFSKFY